MSNAKLSREVRSGELWGTFILCLAIKATATAAVLHRTIAGQAPDSSTVLLVAAFALVALVVYNKDCHYNPGLTLGAALAGAIPWPEVLPRMVRQFVGAIGAVMVIWIWYGTQGRDVAHLGASLPVDGFSLWQVALSEFIGALVFYAITLKVAGNDALSTEAKALGIGLALGVGVTIAGPISGGGINPAIGFAPMLVSLTFTGLPIYLFAPLLAGVVVGLAKRPRKPGPNQR